MSLAVADLQSLRDRSTGSVIAPEDPEYDAARLAFAAHVDQRPAAIVIPAHAGDVSLTVKFARTAGLRVAPQATGHNAAPLGSLEETILLKTSALRGVEIDPERRRARVAAGTLWLELMEAAGAHGLAALGGSSPDVGVVGYSLGGGIGWLARRYGLATNSILAAELVTPDGRLVRVDADHEPDLYFAIRGGGGNFGIVVALELALFPLAEVYGGAMVWDWTEAERVLLAWSEWAADAPDEITTSARIMQLPPLEMIPEPLRGRQLVMIDGAYAGTAEEAEPVLAPLRALRPEMDTFAMLPTAALVRIHGDPEEPVPSASDTTMLHSLPPEAIRAFVRAAGPSSDSVLVMAELRQLGGALGRPAPRHGALPMLDAAFVVFGLGMAMEPGIAQLSREHARRLVEAVEPWSTGRTYLNFDEEIGDTAGGYRTDVHERLQAIREHVDPDGVLHANHALARP